MKQKLLFLGILLYSMLTYGQTKQGFESETFPPEGWTVYHLLGEGKNPNGWSRVKQPAIPANGGEQFAAHSLNGRSMYDADSWLITPAIQVTSGDFLNFQLNIPDADENTKDTLDILISETTNDKAAFNTRLLRLTPTGKMAWSNYCIDLSAYAGKQVHIAFRDHLLKPTSYIQGCEMYLDNVSVSKSATSDLSVSSLISPYNSCADTQMIELIVHNTGKQVDKFSICYQINNGEIVKEDFDRFIDPNESKAIILAKVAELKPGTTNKFKIWTECDKDANAINDTLTSDLFIGSQIPFPYAMSKRATVDTDWNSYGLFSNWQYLATSIVPESTWVYAGTAGSAILGSNCIDLPKGKVRVSFDYILSESAVLKAYTTTAPSLTSYTEEAGKSIILTGNSQLNSTSFSVKVTKEGLQSIGFNIVVPGYEDAGQTPPTVLFIITNLTIEPAIEDLALEEMIQPWGTSITSNDSQRDIEVKVSNIGIDDQKDFNLCYQINNNEPVKEKFAGILKENQSINYAFTSKPLFNKEEEVNLKVWLELAGDFQHGNDSIKKNFYVYKSLPTPYVMSFEDTENNKNWTIDNTNRDAISWSRASIKFKGEKAAYLGFLKDTPNEDRIISPAIKMPKGKARLSFFYVTSSPEGTMSLEILMGKGTHPDSLKTILISQVLTNTDWQSGYAPLDITETDEYYFAFRAYGVNAEVSIDDVRIDTATDACMESVGFVEKSGYNMSHSAIKLAFTNNSAQSISSAKVSYKFGNNEPVSENINTEIKPGQKYEHTFAKVADISTPGTYRVTGTVEVEDDAEEINNSISASVDHYKNKVTPYFQDFEEMADRLKWQAGRLDLNNDNNSWIAAGNLSFTTYSGSTCLYYESNMPGDDWIFSECIEIPAGESEFSFFYCTYKNFADRKESFKVMLGTSPDPASMTTTLADFKDVSFAAPQEHEKVMRRINLEEGGKYYLGFYTNSKASQGCIVIDDISLKPYKEEPPFYQSDFTNRFGEWTRYNLLALSFDQWEAIEEPGKDSRIVQLETFRQKQPGMFVSPGFKMEAGKPIKIDMEYALITTNANDRLALYMGNENHPDSLTTLVEKLPGTTDWSNYTHAVTADKTGRYFFAVKAERAGTEKDILYKLAQFKLTPDGLNRYELRGKLLSSDGTVFKGVTVHLNSGQSQSARTDSRGVFSFAQVLEQQIYTLAISVKGFKPYNRDITLNGTSQDLGEIRLNYILSSPVAIKAALNEEKTAVNINWMVPGTILEYKYDDGTPFGQVGFTSGTDDDIVGSAFRSAAQILEMSWYTSAAGGPHEKVNAYILDLDKDGAPTNKVLYSATDIPNQDLKWNTHTLLQPVNAPNGFMIALSYTSGSIGLAIDDGTGDYPFTTNTCYLGSLSTGQFLTLESQGGKSSYLLRAKGIPGRKESPRAEKATDLSYRLYRFESKDMNDESLWTLLTQSDITETVYIDSTLVKAGNYQYAVKAVYPTGELSLAILSNTINWTKEIVDNIDNEKSMGITIWPVPAKESLTVNSPDIIERYYIHNAIGERVADRNTATREVTIPVGHLAPGVYYINLFTGSKQATHKFIKL